MAEPVLAIRDLCIALHRDGEPARILEGVTLDIAPGEILALVGESGSGKSTLGLALQGLLPADAWPLVRGSIRIAGTEIVGSPAGELRVVRRSLVRAIPQDPMAGLNPTMRIDRQLAESSDTSAPVTDWLKRMGLGDPRAVADAFPHRLSGGQRQRVLIAMAMMAHPKLLVADEPTTALDMATQAQILDLLRELAHVQQTAILLITHDLGVAAALADRVAVLHAGRIVETSRPGILIDAPQHAYTQRLLASRFNLRSDRTRPLGKVEWPTSAPVAKGVALQLVGVSKGYPAGRSSPLGRRGVRPVLRSIDMAIGLGECVALVGSSGAGKSTVLRIAAGLVRPDSGSVTCADRPQMVSQEPAATLTPWLTIGEQIADRVQVKADRALKVREALELVDLAPTLATALPGELSLGQCQRAALARSVVVPPKLLLCDEPVSAMDQPLAASILDLLGMLRRRLGMAILFVTHDLAAARLVADRIAVLRDGELVEEADPDTLIASPLTAYTRKLIDAVPSLRPDK